MSSVDQIRAALARGDFYLAQQSAKNLQSRIYAEYKLAEKISGEYPQVVVSAAQRLLGEGSQRVSGSDLNLRALVENRDLRERFYVFYAAEAARRHQLGLLVDVELSALRTDLFAVRNAISTFCFPDYAVRAAELAINSFGARKISYPDRNSVFCVYSAVQAVEYIAVLKQYISELRSFQAGAAGLGDVIALAQRATARQAEIARDLALQTTFYRVYLATKTTVAADACKTALYDIKTRLTLLSQNIGAKNGYFDELSDAIALLCKYQLFRPTNSRLAVFAQAVSELGESTSAARDQIQKCMIAFSKQFDTLSTPFAAVARVSDAVPGFCAQLRQELTRIRGNVCAGAESVNQCIYTAIAAVGAVALRGHGVALAPIVLDVHVPNLDAPLSRLAASISQCGAAVLSASALVTRRRAYLADKLALIRNYACGLTACVAQLRTQVCDDGRGQMLEKVTKTVFRCVHTLGSAAHYMGGAGAILHYLKAYMLDLQDFTRGEFDRMQNAVYTLLLQRSAVQQTFVALARYVAEFRVELRAVDVSIVANRLDRLNARVSGAKAVESDAFKPKYEQMRDLLAKLQAAKQKTDGENFYRINELQEQLRRVYAKPEQRESAAQTELDVDTLQREVTDLRQRAVCAPEVQIHALQDYRSPKQFIVFYREPRTEPDNVLFSAQELQTMFIEDLKALKAYRKLRERNKDMVITAFSQMRSWIDDHSQCAHLCSQFNVACEDSPQFRDAFRNFIASKYNSAMDTYFQMPLEELFLKVFTKTYGVVGSDDQRRFFRLFSMLFQMSLYDYRIEQAAYEPSEGKVFVFPCFVSPRAPQFDALRVPARELVK